VCSGSYSGYYVGLLCAAVGTAGIMQASNVCSCRYNRSYVGLMFAAVGTVGLM
jgi:hypothetical protein